MFEYLLHMARFGEEKWCDANIVDTNKKDDDK